MAAFDKINSGIPGVDEILDHIRLGDNVVWQVSTIDEFRFFAEPFARQAVKDGRNVIYIRFAQHEPVLRDLSGIKVYEFNPDDGFEPFTVAIYEQITREGRDAFYVFDCLSELQSVWYTDLMMGNFFRVTCPYLFELDTVAYFPLLRGRHSFDAAARIRDTTQLLLDVYTGDNDIYLHPLKVWNRHSSRMFLPHCCRRSDSRSFRAVEDGVGMSRYYQTIQKASAGSQDQNYDSHDRFFAQAKLDFSRGYFSEDTEELIIDSTMTKDDRLKKLVKQYFTPSDYFMLRDRMIGSGAIGGKACGMLLARKIAETEIPEYPSLSEPHDSFYIGSDVFYTYIVSNGCWRLRIRQRTKEEYFSAAEELQEHLSTGEFPAKIREQFLNVIEYFGQSPFIVRSSSFLEDGFGNAFAGKYESVFCVNQGSPQKRLEEFEQAVRTVYASTMDYSALEYRLLRGLEKKDEQMAILVQRVSGSYQGQYFMPCAAGVGYSHSAYKWYPDMDPEAGMLRIVMGLGTKAVDRTKEDYPRLSNLDRPSVTVLTTVEQKHKFSQRNIDVLDCGENRLKEIPLEELLPVLPLWYKKMVLEHDYEAEYRLRQLGRNQDVWFVSCQRLLEKQEFTSLMQKILKTLERVYKNPVDIEYTVNTDESGDFVVNLLQCRPLYIGEAGEKTDLKNLRLKKTFFDIRDSSMGPSGKRKIDVVVQVDPVLYYQYPYRKKYDAAAALGKINRHYRGSGQNLLLMTPGRIGTSSPELGVPVSFGDISGFSAICEISESRAGYMPELSYGSHMFQDLVEAQILYGAIFNNKKTLSYHPELFDGCPDLFQEICPDMPELSGIIKVHPAEYLYYWLDALSNRAVCGIPE
ncbi:MAG TPA: PEP/pyruvate-binding domain-containing protein [Candidatus Blautia faecipullorum]|nr:PEP/pyruvate-binding domain-containing protein [Candidatus Blautia faecipullorum]